MRRIDTAGARVPRVARSRSTDLLPQSVLPVAARLTSFLELYLFLSSHLHMSGSESGHNEADLQRLLDAHGQKFMELFDTSALTAKRKGSPGPGRASGKKRKTTPPKEDYEEWTGFGGSVADSNETVSEDAVSDSGEIAGTHNPPPRSFVRANFSSYGIVASSSRLPDIIVFSDSRAQSSAASASKAQMKAFMVGEPSFARNDHSYARSVMLSQSSKVSKLSKAVDVHEDNDEASSEDEADLYVHSNLLSVGGTFHDFRVLSSTNLQNDAILHRLVHTQLLSGSLEPDLDIKASKRRKALAGRVMEVAGQAKLGKGEGSVRATEHNKASKKVRDGMLAKQGERVKKSLEEVSRNWLMYHLSTNEPPGKRRR